MLAWKGQDLLSGMVLGHLDPVFLSLLGCCSQGLSMLRPGHSPVAIKT